MVAGLEIGKNRVKAVMDMRHHLAILYPTYIRLIASGIKSIECRLSHVPLPPYRMVEAGDLIWLKEAGGPVRLVAHAVKVQDLAHLTRTAVVRLRRRLGHRIRAEPTFWRERQSARFATLIWLGDVQTVEPFRVLKTSSAAWVVLDEAPTPGQVIAS